MNRIKEVRKERGMTQAQLGRALGVREAAISKYESEATTLSYETAYSIAGILGVTTDYLMCKSDEGSPYRIESEQSSGSYFYFSFDDDQGERLQELMSGRGLNAAALSKKSGISQKAIENALSSSGADLRTIMELASFFDVSVDYLLCRTDYPGMVEQGSEEGDLLEYYSRLTRIEKRWIMGQMTDLLIQKNDAPKAMSVAADKQGQGKQMKASAK